MFFSIAGPSHVFAQNCTGTECLTGGTIPTYTTDTTLLAGVTTIKKTNITDLRTIINAKRVAMGMCPYSWTDTINAGAVIRGNHIAELRTAIKEIYNAPWTPPTFTDDPIVPGVTFVRKVHQDELRSAIANAKRCGDGLCQAPETSVNCPVDCDMTGTCVDGVRNHGELGVDCGMAACGTNCPFSCPLPPCNFNTVCDAGETPLGCPTDCGTCFDGVRNHGETGVDCGGPCPLCGSCPQIDKYYLPNSCGGEQLVPTRANGGSVTTVCSTGGDCSGNYTATCVNGSWSFDIRCCGDGIIETGEQCDDSNPYNNDGCSDTCQCDGGMTWNGSSCVPAGACNNNGVKDNGETGIDCGGGGCGSCCGNGVIDTGEVCDSYAVSGQTCVSQGYTSQVGPGLVCNATCSGYDPKFCMDCPSDFFQVCNGWRSTSWGKVGEVKTMACPATCTGGPITRTCQAGGTWGPVTGTCTAFKCNDYYLPGGSLGPCSIELTGNVNTAFSQSCPAGYCSPGTTTATCDANGFWQSVSSWNGCTQINCPPIVVPGDVPACDVTLTFTGMSNVQFPTCPAGCVGNNPFFNRIVGYCPLGWGYPYLAPWAGGSTQCIQQSACNNNGTCDAGESSTTCPADCKCGNGTIEGAEVCDGNNLNGQTCASKGFVSGTLGCVNCAFNTSGCVNYTCGNSTCESANGENYINCPGDCSKPCPDASIDTSLGYVSVLASDYVLPGGTINKPCPAGSVGSLQFQCDASYNWQTTINTCGIPSSTPSPAPSASPSPSPSPSPS